MDLGVSILVYAIAFIIAYRLLRYFTTPVFKKLGWYRYHSRMLFTQRMPNNRVELHLGTSYDFFHMDAQGPRLFLAYLAEGMLDICAHIEDGRISRDTEIRGCIYFLDRATLRRFGFRTRNLTLFEQAMFSLNYLELCMLLSISRKRPCRVKIKDVKIAYCIADDFLANKPLYTRIDAQLHAPAAKAPPAVPQAPKPAPAAVVEPVS